MSGKNFTENEKFQGNNYLTPEESPEDGWFCIVNNVMSPYDLYDILSLRFLVSDKQIYTHVIQNPNIVNKSLMVKT